ncbi:MAG: Gfo/Idh/MocA family oxidoreductase [Candidatus Tectomicrobia bacterium]|uniref:Gfo/Idh/MocA family oxidoreductase n=1 Tax=Tectimicrobiota bacterium TaxID=2528274 RepID=A0A932HX71_UNCTE|nr:Gfo/Idh/MocA family oxidoreductase [Candidatus Tectomicrobia bacterium]
MRYGVVGLGSMGSRRVRCLAALGREVVGFDIRPDRMRSAEERFGIRTAESFEAMLRLEPEALVISTPPDQHLPYYERACALGLPYFSEASIFVPRAEWFATREKEKGAKGYPSATWRFYPWLRELHRQLRHEGRPRVHTVHYAYGGFLPRWHPWEPYEDFYAGRERKTCAARETVPFDLEWLCWIFGPVRAVSCAYGRTAEWRTDIDDTYLLLLEFESGLLGTMTAELHQVAPFRSARVGCEGMSFELDFTTHKLRTWGQEEAQGRILKPAESEGSENFDFERVYMAESSAFVDAMEGRSTYPKTWVEERHLSNVLYAAEESWRRRAWVDVAEAESAHDGCSWIEVDS